jgi:hypothetical protein
MVALFGRVLALSKPCIDDVYNFSIANQCPILISAANMAGCLPSIVYNDPGRLRRDSGRFGPR